MPGRITRMAVTALAFTVLALGGLIVPGLAQDTAPPNVKIATIRGKQVLTDANGMALYTFANDKEGSNTSACNGPCAQLWPPLSAPANFTPAGGWSVVQRQDGGKQLAHGGKPLYTYSKDKPGEDTGDGFRGNWHVATPAG